MAGEQLFQDSEGAWICKRHQVERGSNKYGSNCYRCKVQRIEQLQADLIWQEKKSARLDIQKADLQAELDAEKAYIKQEEGLGVIFKNKFVQLQYDFTELKETVQINCTPPDDCNDPVVLKTYMKACFAQANK